LTLTPKDRVSRNEPDFFLFDRRSAFVRAVSAFVRDKQLPELLHVVSAVSLPVRMHP
jgi:hypothetical protein